MAGGIALIVRTSRAAGPTAKVAPAAATPAHGSVPVPSGPAGAVALQQRFTAQIQPLLQKHCYSCHGNGKQKGDLSLDRFNSLLSVQSDRRTWTHISDIMRQKLMPPDTKTPLTQAEFDTLLGWVSDALAYCDCSGPRDPGRVAIHRLNRTEYNNTVRDLLGIADFRAGDDFPADDTGYGFDNIADVLNMSTLLAEKYIAAAELAVDKALPAGGPAVAKVKQYKAGQFEGNSDGMLGTETDEVFVRFDAPADGKYEVRVRAGQDKAGPEAAKMLLKVAGKDVRTSTVEAPAENPAAFKERVELKAGKQKIAATFLNNYKVLNHPDRSKRGDRNLHIAAIEVEGPFDAVPPPPPDSARKLIFVTPGPQLAEADAARQVIKRFATRAYRRPVTFEDVEPLLRLFKVARGQGESYEGGIKLALTAALVSPNFLYRIEYDRPDLARPAASFRLSDYELATRLSYYLWSSMPDDTLFTLAEAGRLRDPAVLDAQVKRMLADPRAKALVTNFAGQWLELRNLDDYSPDAKAYPKFNGKLRAAMRTETEMFFEHVLREDRSVLEMLDSDYTFLNERLARHYGIEGVMGEEFRKVSLGGPAAATGGKPSPASQRRGGVLTMASVLTVTAMPTRTSPVKRGKFVMEQILGTPPPPAPADVPSLSEKPGDVNAATLKKRLEQHREDPNCAVCHMRMDVIGFSMENFDAIGMWREKDGPFPIDPTGTLPEGQTLAGPDSLKKMLMARKGEFVHNLAEKMLTYATGRGMEYFDQCTVKDIASATEANGNRFSGLVMGVVKSDAFQKRRVARASELQPPATRPATPR